MGLGGISFGQLLLIFLIILVLFGTKRLRSMGADLGAAFRNFKKGLQESEETAKEYEDASQAPSSNTLEHQQCTHHNNTPKKE